MVLLFSIAGSEAPSAGPGPVAQDAGCQVKSSSFQAGCLRRLCNAALRCPVSGSAQPGLKRRDAWFCCQNVALLCIACVWVMVRAQTSACFNTPQLTVVLSVTLLPFSEQQLLGLKLLAVRKESLFTNRGPHTPQEPCAALILWLTKHYS